MDAAEALPTLTGSLRGVASLRIDAKRTCLAGKAIDYEISSDGPARITFSDGRKLALEGGKTDSGTLPR